MDRFQQKAIDHLSEGHSVLVSAPTGTGKTVVADYLVHRCLQAGQGLVYTAPVKALSNQKYRDYSARYGDSRIGLVTGDLVINPDAPARIMTTEILRNMLLQGEDRISELSHVIFDEIHFLSDPERGTVWEEILIYLPPRVQILGLSATLPNIDEFARWQSWVRGQKMHVVEETKRAVPLEIRLFNRRTNVVSRKEFDRAARRENQGTGGGENRRRRSSRGKPHRHGKRGDRRQRRETQHHHVIEALRPDLLPCLYFAFFRKLCERFAGDLSRRIDGSLLAPEEMEESRRIIDARSEGWPSALLRNRALYLKGIAYHHAGLHVHLKALVEELYERRLIRVLYCTSTFALGINMPVRTVVFDGIEKFDGERMSPLTVGQFMQKAGRAGRRGMDEVGHVVVKQDFADYSRLKEHFDRYRKGSHEPVRSAFNLCFNSVVNLLESHSLSEIEEIVSKSFRNFHRRERIDSLEQKMAAEQDLLEDLLGPEHPLVVTPVGRTERQNLDALRRLEETINDRVLRRLTARRDWLGPITDWQALLDNGGAPERLAETLEPLVDQVRPGQGTRLNRLIRDLRGDARALDRMRSSHHNELHGGHDPTSPEGRAVRMRRKIGDIQHQLRRENRLRHRDLSEKIQFLREIRYIEEDNRLLAGGHILQHIHIEEILVTELVLANAFSGLDPATLFGSLAALCTDLPRAASLRIRMPAELRDPYRALSRVHRSPIVRKAETINGVRSPCSPDLLHLGWLWANGRPLAQLMSSVDAPSDLSGDLVSAFRRAKDLLKQLRAAHEGDAGIADTVAAALRLVSRDEVEVVA